MNASEYEQQAEQLYEQEAKQLLGELLSEIIKLRCQIKATRDHAADDAFDPDA